MLGTGGASGGGQSGSQEVLSQKGVSLGKTARPRSLSFTTLVHCFFGELFCCWCGYVMAASGVHGPCRLVWGTNVLCWDLSKGTTPSGWYGCI